MSIYEKAGIALVPSGYKASKLYSTLPKNGVGDFDFTRATTATRVNSDGLIESVASNEPRLDYPIVNGVVQATPSLLLEPARTNLALYSEDLSQGSWSKTGSSIVSGFVSPKGDLSAFKIVETTSTSRHSVWRQITGMSGTSNVVSVFFKQGEQRYASIVTSDTTRWNTMVVVDLQNGLITKEFNVSGFSSVNKIEAFADGWYRLSASISGTYIDSALYARFCIQNSGTPSDPPSNTYTGDGTSGIYIWGPQVEAGSYPTSYIPTSGSAVTRNADVANGAGDASTFNDSEGVLMVEARALANDGTYKNICLSDGGLINRILIQYTPTANQINVVIIYSGGQYLLSHTVSDVKNFSKFLIKYKVNDLALWVNGFEVDTSTNSNLPIGLNTLSFDNTIGDVFYSNTKQLMTFKEALTDAELENLTSWDSFIELAQGQQYIIY